MLKLMLLIEEKELCKDIVDGYKENKVKDVGDMFVLGYNYQRENATESNKDALTPRAIKGNTPEFELSKPNTITII